MPPVITDDDARNYRTEFEFQSAVFVIDASRLKRQLAGNGIFLPSYEAVFKTGAINRSATPPENW
jgi:hypothetical protein